VRWARAGGGGSLFGNEGEKKQRDHFTDLPDIESEHELYSWLSIYSLTEWRNVG
jgi:hypothetical protein